MLLLGMEKKKRPRDFNQLAASIVSDAIGEKKDVPKEDSNKNPAAVSLGRLGGLKGGKARAKKLSADERSDIARVAAQARWKKTER